LLVSMNEAKQSILGATRTSYILLLKLIILFSLAY
jgi:hypothetical protein